MKFNEGNENLLQIYSRKNIQESLNQNNETF